MSRSNVLKILNKSPGALSKSNDDDEGDSGVANAMYVTAAAAVASAADLQFVLLDFHGGIEDVSTRVLRAPVPRDASLEFVYAAAVITPRDMELAAQLGLNPTASEAGGAEGEEEAAGMDAPVERSAAVDREAADVETRQQLIQTLWWGKMLREDPLRLLRALRFSATLGFRLHHSFWAAAPFALQPGALDTKVSHTRKLSELYKMAKAGPAKLVDFFAIVFDPVSSNSYLTYLTHRIDPVRRYQLRRTASPLHTQSASPLPLPLPSKRPPDMLVLRPIRRLSLSAGAAGATLRPFATPCSVSPAGMRALQRAARAA